MENTAAISLTGGGDGAAARQQQQPLATGGGKMTIRFQCGLLRETETFAEDDMQEVSLPALLEYVDEMLNMKVCIPTTLW